MKKEIVISVENLDKDYRLYDNKMDRLKEALTPGKKSYHQVYHALHDVSFQIGRGETVGIIGTNGSGKSTILKIITGVLTPTSGNVRINGRISALLELGAGFNMEYTGIQNIYLNGTMIGFTEEEIESRMKDILEFADIGDFVYQPVKTYSSGMFVRLAFAVAINIDPEILIVDEALSVGDVFFQAKCYRKFEEFKKQGKTILFVSHDLGSISKYCDRVVLLNKGKKVAEGKPKQIVDMYKKILTGFSADLNEKKAEDENEQENTAKQENEAENVSWKSRLNVNPAVVEYGNKDAEIIDFDMIDANGNHTNTIEKDTEYAIRMKVLFHKPIKDPIFAVTIKDLKGNELCGTNTMMEDQYVPEQKEGAVRVVTFRQKMNLQGAEYLLSLGCTGFRDGEFTIYHRLYDVCNVSVLAERSKVGYFDMYSQVDVK